MVNFLSMFCPELQKLLKPIYDLTRKGRSFIWGKEQQDSFEEITHRLIRPPVLHMPYKTDRFHLYSDTSKFATGRCTISNTKWELQTDCICKQKTSRSSKELLYNRTGIMWFSHKY